MNLENRYVVIKRKDLKGLPEHLHRALTNAVAHANCKRKERGASQLECLVVERDWPEYDPVLEMVSQRVDAEGEKVLHIASELFGFKIHKLDPAQAALWVEFAKRVRVVP